MTIILKILLFSNQSSFFNLYWTSQKKLIASLTFKRFCTNDEVDKINLCHIKDYVQYKSVELIRRKLLNQKQFKYTYSSPPLKSSHSLRSLDGIKFQTDNNFGTINNICISKWNELKPEAQMKLSAQQKLPMKKFLDLIV